jgi:hypothetical protein
MQLTPPQQTISDCASRFRVAACGRRFGKSYLSINEMAKYARHPNRRILYVAPTYRQAKTVIWDELKTQLIQRNWAKKINESDLSIRLINNSIITVRSTDSYDNLRGGKYDFIVLDECGDIHNQAWYSVLRPTLSDTGGHALFIGSPKGRNWFYDLWIQAGNTEDWSSFQFTTLDGGNVPQEEIEAAKRDLDVKTFEAEYLAQFVTDTSVIFYSFTEENIKPYTDLLPDVGALHVGIDFNVNPMSAVVCVKGKDWLHVIDEIEIYSSDTNELAQEIRRRYGYQRQILVYPDASGAKRTTNSPGISDHIILQNAGFKLQVDPTNPPVAEAIASVNALFCNTMGQRRLFIDPKCRKLRECILKYSYKSGTRIPDKESGWDHMADSLRYVSHRLFPLRVLPQTTFVGSLQRNIGRMV